MPWPPRSSALCVCFIDSCKRGTASSGLSAGMAGDYCNCGNCPPNHTVAIAQGIRNHLQGSKITVATAPGCARNDTSKAGFVAALAVASKPEVSHIVLAVGMDGHLEGEGNDLLPSRFPVPAENAGLRLPGVQQSLVQKIAAIGKPTVLIIVSGGSYSIAPQTPGIGAILHALYPGVEAGNGIAGESGFGLSTAIPVPFVGILTAVPLPFHCLSLDFPCLSLAFPWPFHCLSIAFLWPFPGT